MFLDRATGARDCLEGVCFSSQRRHTLDHTHSRSFANRHPYRARSHFVRRARFHHVSHRMQAGMTRLGSSPASGLRRHFCRRCYLFHLGAKPFRVVREVCAQHCQRSAPVRNAVLRRAVHLRISATAIAHINASDKCERCDGRRARARSPSCVVLSDSLTSARIPWVGRWHPTQNHGARAVPQWYPAYNRFNCTCRARWVGLPTVRQWHCECVPARSILFVASKDAQPTTRKAAPI